MLNFNQKLYCDTEYLRQTAHLENLCDKITAGKGEKFNK